MNNTLDNKIETTKQAYTVYRNKIKSEDKDIMKNIVNKMIDINNDRIAVKYIKSTFNLVSVTGRYPCVSLSSSESFVILTDEGWLELKATKEDTERIKRIAIRDKGSLYVKIRPSGFGYVLDEQLREDVLI